ncbi:unnamed protein product [Closterium sp. Yama58-4]|nr:unnamed protein product [Closterium sp. Yama58-4]
MANWTLAGCCNTQQTLFLSCSGVYALVILVLWRTIVLMPFKLISVYLHEIGHASACVMTGGKVEGIEVHMDEGGVTRTRGGWQWCILPAGYLGSSFWGMVLVLCATNKWTTLVIAVILCITLFITLFLAKNNTLRFLCVGFLLLFGLFFFLEYGITQSVHPLNLAILFIGIMNCLFSIYDIYDDLISRRVNSSDAEVFAKTCPCPFNGVCWGVIWGVISLFLAAAAVYLGLVILA